MLISGTCLARTNLNIRSLCRLSSVNVRSMSSDSSEKSPGFLEKTFGLASNTGSPNTNRWSMFLPAFCTHVCLGAPYGWSAISAQLTRENGLVTSAASDWALDLASYPMSVMIAAGGLSAASLGKWTIKVGQSRFIRDQRTSLYTHCRLGLGKLSPVEDCCMERASVWRPWG